MKTGYVYILTNKPFGALYIGVTSNLVKRVQEHRELRVEGFSKRYGLDQLVYYEVHAEMNQAIAKEQLLKSWDRNRKLREIKQHNPDWNDLYDDAVRKHPS